MLQVLQQFTQQGGALILTSHDSIAAATLQARQTELPLSMETINQLTAAQVQTLQRHSLIQQLIEFLSGVRQQIE